MLEYKCYIGKKFYTQYLRPAFYRRCICIQYIIISIFFCYNKIIVDWKTIFNFIIFSTASSFLKSLQTNIKGNVVCFVGDLTILSIVFQKSSNGQHLLERVFTHMDILERDYFGLKYLDVNSVSQWLDPRKPIKKQSKDKGEKTLSHIKL